MVQSIWNLTCYFVHVMSSQVPSVLQTLCFFAFLIGITPALSFIPWYVKRNSQLLIRNIAALTIFLQGMKNGPSKFLSIYGSELLSEGAFLHWQENDHSVNLLLAYMYLEQDLSVG